MKERCRQTSKGWLRSINLLTHTKNKTKLDLFLKEKKQSKRKKGLPKKATALPQMFIHNCICYIKRLVGHSIEEDRRVRA